MSVLLFKKSVDQSLLKDGLTVPKNSHDDVMRNIGKNIEKGQSSVVTLVLDGKEYSAQFYRIKHGEQYAHVETCQIRYGRSNPFCQRLIELFSYSMDFLERNEEIPEKEYIELYADGNGRFVVKCMPHHRDTAKDTFLKYIGSETDLNGYQRSYKLVFLKALFENWNDSGEIPAYNVSLAFQQFYIARKQKGLIPDANVDLIIENVETSSVKSVFGLIVRNPYDAISKRGFVSKIVKNEKEYFKFQEKLTAGLNAKDIQEILQLIDKKLTFYYSKIDPQEQVNGKMQEMINKILNEYVTCKKEPFAGHSMGIFFRNEIPNEIYNTGIVDSKDYLITGSVGQGNWATVPWVCIFDRAITTSATKGVYIVYLLAKDGNTLYLTFNQGCTKIRETHSKKDTIKIMRQNAAQIVAKIDSRGFATDENINLGNGLTELAELYQKGTIFYKAYRKGNVPSEAELQADLTKMMDIYREYAGKQQVDNVWWPSEKEYTPGLSKSRWLDLLNNSTVFTPSTLTIMAQFDAMGGQATCAQLAEAYGNTANYYLMSCVHLAERIIRETGCPVHQEGDRKRYWTILFIGKDANANERGSFIWKLRQELAEAIKEFEIHKYLTTGGEEELSTKDIIAQIKNYIASKGFTYEDGLVENFYLSLKSKPFVILAGTSGTGKTRLVKLFAEACGATTANGRYKMVSVRPDWSDSSDLFGHVDLNGKFIPGAIIDFVKKAELDTAKPYFLCLDEMNLARVEYYLSDVLSVIETRDFVGGTITSDPLVDGTYYGSDKFAAGKYGTVTLPENLYIIGTVNMDETTFPFSRKVLDRANTIEFSFVDLAPNYRELPPNVGPMDLPNRFLKTEYLLLAQCTDQQDKVDEFCVELQAMNRILQGANAHVGYRVRDEIVFYMLNNQSADLLTENDAMDNEIMQKILPRIQGSSASVKRMLCELFKHCAGDFRGFQTDDSNLSDEMEKVSQKPGCKYKRSAEKIAFMVRRYEEDGFTSYWL